MATQRRPAAPTVAAPRSVDEWTVKHLNNDLILMVLIAWEQGVGGANMAIVDRADACGFDMRCLDARGRATHVRVPFASAPCATQGAVRRELASMRERAARPRLPLTPIAALVCVMWAVLGFAWCHRHGVHVLEETVARKLGLHEEDVPSSKEFLTYCTLAILAANAIEGAAVVFLARRRFAFSTRNCVGWFLAALLAGYPVAQKMLELKQARSRALIAAYRNPKKSS